MTSDTVVGLTDDLIALFDPLVQAIDDADSLEALLHELGYQIPSGATFLQGFAPLLTALAGVADQADDLLRTGGEPDHLALFRNLIDAIQDIVKAIRDISATVQSLPADFLAATNMVEQLPRQLADYLLVKMLERRHPVLHSTLALAGIVEQREVATAATLFNVPYTQRTVRWEKIGDYLSSPTTSIEQAYGWNTDNFAYDDLVDNLHRFGRSINFFSGRANPDPDTLQALHGGADVVTEDNAAQLRILDFPLLRIAGSPIGAQIYPVLNTAKDKAIGFAVGLYFDPTAGLSFPVADNLSLDVKYTGAAPLDASILVLPAQPLTTVSNIFAGTGPQVDLSQFVPEFTYSNDDQKTLLFDTGFGAKLEFASWVLRAGALAKLAGFFVETDLKGATLTIGGSEGDGFLQSILPTQPMSLDFELTIGFSSTTGLYFGGSASLEIKIPTNITMGPITLSAITVSVKPANGAIPVSLGGDVAASLGPVDVVVENIGATVSVSFPANRDGNAGPVNVSLGFKAPDGAGLSVNSAGVSGGGFLKYSDQAHEYSGVLQLEFNDLALQAFGLVTTQVAGRSWVFAAGAHRCGVFPRCNSDGGSR